MPHSPSYAKFLGFAVFIFASVLGVWALVTHVTIVEVGVVGSWATMLGRAAYRNWQRVLVVFEEPRRDA